MSGEPNCTGVKPMTFCWARCCVAPVITAARKSGGAACADELSQPEHGEPTAPCRHVIRVPPLPISPIDFLGPSAVAIRIAMTALPITSAGRSPPRGRRGITPPFMNEAAKGV
jgi:hypothetical protein